MKIFPLIAFCTLNGYILAHVSYFPSLWIAVVSNMVIIALYSYVEIHKKRIFEV